MSGYDKRIRIGVDAVPAVDSAIDKLLKVKKLEDDLDGRTATVTAKVKPDTSEVDKLQGKTITIPAVLDLVGKTGNLSKNQKKAIETSVKAAQDFANKVATKSGSKGVRDLQKYYQLSNKELDGVKRGMPKELLTGSKEYEDLYKQRVTHSAGMKWLQKQTEEIDSFLSGNFNSEKQYLEAIQERSRQITNVQNVLKGNWENMGEYKPSSKNTKNDDKKITTYVAGLQEKLQDSILGHFDLSQVISDIDSGDYSGISTQISSQVKQMEKAIEEIIPKERNYRSRLNTALKKVGITSKQAYDNLVKDPHFGLDKIKTKGKVDNTKVDEIIDDLLETQTGDPTYASISKFLSSFIAYKRRNATGLSKEEQGFYQALYDRLSTYQDFTTNAEGEKKNLKYDASDVISALNSAWDNLHTQRQAIEDKSNEIEDKIGTTPSKSSTRKVTKKENPSAQNITPKSSVYDSVVNADYSASGKNDAKNKLINATKELDEIRDNMDIPVGSLSEVAALYKARRYYISALQNGLHPQDLNGYSPYTQPNTNLESAQAGLKGLEQRLLIYSDIYSKIDAFDSNLLSHNSVRNAADNFGIQLFKRNKKHHNGTLTEDDLDKTLEYENHLIKQIQKKTSKDTSELYFIDQKRLYDELSDPTTQKSSTTSSPTAQAKKTEKTADAVDTAVDHINNAVASAAGNTTENMDKMTDSTERLGIATQDTTKKQEESVKQNENRYKVINAPKLKPTTSTTSTTVPVSSTPPVIPTTPSTPSGSGRPTNNPPSIPPSNSSPAPNIPNFDAMQLLAESTARNGNKITKVYKDVNRKVHTLTQTYDEANDTWISTVDTGIKFEKLEEESAKNTSALVSNRQRLYAETTKPSSQRDSKKIANLRSEIIRLENQQQEYDSIARAYDQDSTSDYSMLQYRQQVAKKMEPNWSKLRDQNINAVNSNKEAYQKEREKTQKQQTQGILDQYSNAVKQAQKLNQVNKEILDVQKQLDDKSNTGADKTKLQSDLRDLKNQKTSLEKDLNAFKISDFIVQNKDLLESQGKDIDEFGKAMRQAEKSNSSLKNYSQHKFSDQIISQYEDLMSGLSELEKKNKELSSAKSKGSSDDVIKNLRKEIEQKQQNLGDIDKFIQANKNTLGEDRVNAFNTQKSKLGQAEQNVYDTFQQDTVKQKTADFTAQYDSAIGKVKELKQAQVDLMNAQNEYKINSTDNAVAQRFEDAKQRVEALKTEVDSFYKDTYTRDKDNNGILNTKKANEYEKAYLSAQTAESNYHKNLVADMKEQYSLQTKAERELIKLSASDKYSQQEHMLLSAAQARAKQSYENMYKEVSQIYGKDYADTQMQDLISQSNVNKNNTINSNFASLSKDIDSFVSKIQNAGRASESFKSQFSSLSSGLDTATTEFKNGSISVNDYVSRMLELRNQTEAYKDYYQNGLGVKDLDYFQAHEKLIKYTNIGDKTGFYQAKLDGFHSRYEELNDTFKNSTKGQKDIEAYSKGIDELVASMEKFGKTSDGFNKTTSKGTMIESTAHQIKDTADASKALTDYAASIGLTNKISQSINDSTGKVTMNFETASGDVVKLTGNIEKANNSLRVMYENTTKASTGFASFGQGIKGLITGNFQGALGDITQYVANFQIMYKAINQMKQGFSTFMDYNKTLTTISYTMDMSQDQLQSLGTSAVDMAKDLSMSLDNTMDIYQIYANMNTSSKEIQETAKPTAILSNLSGVDASTAADQVQGILQQFHMLEDGSTSAADASMHVVDVMDKISSNVGMDYAKGIKVMSDAVQASGQVAYDAGMSYEQLAAISAKVAERTREDGSSIGNAIKTIITRTTKVGKMPQYADEIDNATLSNASASLHSVGIDVYNPDGSDRGIITIMSELKDKWDDLSDAQQAKISYDVAATRQTSKFKNIIDAFTDSMSLAEEATTTQGNAEANQEKYMESFSGKVQAIKTQMDEFWLNFYQSGQVNGALDFVHSLTEAFTGLEKTLGPIPALITAIFAAMTVKNATMAGLKFLTGGGIKTAVG